MKVILGHFFTYGEDGRYYAKWSGAGRSIPQDLSPDYRGRNVRELQLEREQLYLYMLVPKALFTASAAEPHDYREAVIRFDEAGPNEDSFLPTLVHSVYRRIETPNSFHDFVFFESVDGLGVAIPAAARGAVSPSVEQFLATIPADPAQRSVFLEESRHVINGDPPLVQLRATLAEGAGDLSLPQGATLRTTAGRVRSIFAPSTTPRAIAGLWPSGSRTKGSTATPIRQRRSTPATPPTLRSRTAGSIPAPLSPTPRTAPTTPATARMSPASRRGRRRPRQRQCAARRRQRRPDRRRADDRGESGQPLRRASLCLSEGDRGGQALRRQHELRQR